jgi:hypothetical protein
LKKERKKPVWSKTLLTSHFMMVSLLACSSTWKLEATCLYETSVDFQWTTRRYIPKDRTLHNHRCDDMQSHPFFANCFTTILSVALPCQCGRMVLSMRTGEY